MSSRSRGPADSKASNPKDSAATTRIDLSLYPASACAYGSLGMTEGDLKYGGFNYRVAGVRVSVYYAAARRHLDRYFFCGEWEDPKTRVPHLASALACLGILVDSIEQGNVNDDRPPKQSPALYARFEEIVAHLQRVLPRRAVRYREDLHGQIGKAQGRSRPKAAPARKAAQSRPPRPGVRRPRGPGHGRPDARGVRRRGRR